MTQRSRTDANAAERQGREGRTQICRLRCWSGDPATIGAQVAAYLCRESPHGRRLLAGWRAWRAQPAIAARAAAIEAVLARHWPPVLLEMLAMARSIGVDPRPVLAEWAAPPRRRGRGHRDSSTSSANGGTGSGASAGGSGQGRSCTAFWIPADHSATGRPLVGRNFDLRLSDPERLMTWTMTQAGWPHCGMSGRAGRTEGINAAGLIVATTEAQLRPEVAGRLDGSAEHGERIGARAAATGALPARLVTRIVLERCATVDQAIAVISGLAQWTHFTFLVADAAGQAAVVEVGVGHTAVRRPTPPESPFLVTTNHFVASTLEAETDYRWMTRQKYQNTLAGLAEAAGRAPISFASAAEEITPRAFGPGLTPADCQAVLARPGVVQRHVTLWSQVFEAGGEAIWLAPGRPDRNVFLMLPAPAALVRRRPAALGGLPRDVTVLGHGGAVGR